MKIGLRILKKPNALPKIGGTPAIRKTPSSLGELTPQEHLRRSLKGILTHYTGTKNGDTQGLPREFNNNKMCLKNHKSPKRLNLWELLQLQ
ncbi:hypothetical protein [Leptospira santarosai]|uniref:hypothetical protein n=1 Tax=Leptospira santarosai TaxID=28183 RepID=UPI000519C86D|nr:hypothetical protein [Leptospira santarosai]